MALAFPKMFDKNSVKVVDGPEGTKNNLSLMLSIEKGEQLGDPDFGVNLYKSKFKSNTALALELAVDGILEAQKFVGNVLFFREGVTVTRKSVGSIDITIEAVFSRSVNQKELLILNNVEVD